MADLDYKKENMKELHAPDKKVKAGVYVIAALLVLVYLLPIYVMLNQSFRFMADLSPRLYLPEKEEKNTVLSNQRATCKKEINVVQ